LILGIGAGWNEPEYQAFGLPFDHRVDRFEEALQILGPLLQEGHVDFAGQYYQARNCDIVPRGPRAFGPPLLVGSEQGPRMLKLTAQYADLWNTGYMGKPETMAEPLAKIEAACREIGRDPATLGITALIGLWFPDLQAKQPSFFDKPLTGSVPRDRSGNARLCGTRRAAHHVSMRAVHPPSAKAPDRGAPTLSRHGAALRAPH
jgi:alkanesulfonate monooxygenase SsuD/methylene tetrahydromethanopterin reductase-like flavin-dependent oxidoreductase (luciferase family)